MNQTGIDLILLGAAFVLILTNAFFVAAEFALVTIRKTRVEELVAQGNAAAPTLRRVIQNPDQLIATTQLGITIASLALGWIGEPAVANLIESAFGIVLSPLLSVVTAATISTIIGFTLITFLTVLLGELVPKSIALGYTDQVALVVATPMWLFETLFRPATWVLNTAGKSFLRLFGLKRPTGHQMVHSVDELKMLVSASTASGELEPVEREIANRAFEFADRQVGEVMIPRTAIRAVEDTATLRDFLELFSEVSHSRFPVYNGTLDNIIGFVWVKDVLRAFAKNSNARELPIKSVLRNALFVPTTKPIGELFREMQRQKIQMAIVLDEYGGTAGMVTIEELIEEIVGRVSDELAVTAPQLRRVEDGQIEADAMLRVDEANAQLGIDLPESDDYETLAGLVLTRMGRVPKEGESIRIGNLKLTAAKIQGPRIEKILLTKIGDKKS